MSIATQDMRKLNRVYEVESCAGNEARMRSFPVSVRRLCLLVSAMSSQIGSLGTISRSGSADEKNPYFLLTIPRTHLIVDLAD